MGLRVKRFIKSTDPVWLAMTALLSVLSIVTLWSVGCYGKLELKGMFGDFKPFYTQIFASVLGYAGMLVLSFVDYRRLAEWRLVHVVAWGLVLLTFIPGVGYEPPGTGSRSWIAMPLGMSLQPTEIAKISFTLTFALHLAKVRGAVNRPRNLVGVLAHMLLPVLVVHLQGDDGTALIFLAIGVIMLVAAGLNRWVVSGCAAAVAAALPFVWQRVMSLHQRERFLGLLNPEAYADTIMYQQLQGRQAVQNGGLLGTGLFGGTHHYVPRPENDFIFSYYAEATGFVGCVLLLGLLFGLMFKTLRRAARATDATGAFICVGVFAALLVQTVVNVGMNLMLLPVMGITLPFFSAGGTSVLMLYLCSGLVLSVCRVQKTTPTLAQIT